MVGKTGFEPATPCSQGKWQKKAQEILVELCQKQKQNLKNSGHDPDQARVSVDQWSRACKQAEIPKNRFSDVKKHFRIEDGYVSC